MTRYALNLPVDLKHEAEILAKRQGVSLNQFIMWAVSEKVTSLRNELNDPNFPLITYRRGSASDFPIPVIRGTGVRVQTLVQWIKFGESPKKVAEDYDLDIKQIQEAQAFYKVHKTEIDANIKYENDMEKQYIREHEKKNIKAKKHVKAKTTSR